MNGKIVYEKPELIVIQNDSEYLQRESIPDEIKPTCNGVTETF